ncbi:hypothetical protein YpB42003004_1468 [Yersinia pestis biovar Antiqua str. B42003004]|uniref:Uncharacterized protein n=1 Tax=Yersinia pestis biovar Orientalis str. IP275 TaxID=373665 RepID=A0AAV3B585_YERPE|nr:hypothetical protein YpAngola_A2410 [Yersinia pestis Angola]EDR31845.1 hypothetical protein YPIP275_0623 [Yersinia pestis biovar Orientalis str. IP275]EDR36960.1 hypothetical protein YpF1991016_4254 [Yersinia pestis biovar Orientalis str. F1991016]EDR44035.1 hypothetical protein YpE1979001_0446 [Yersinia pestis biovar Antiqua str. E1979001]EDR52346.1 hypothetical protein YpB42003004_1468 [Yersinia pestis biovar Antiqua str. B42003004]EDR57934.1 hypothetical protein YpMG051020_3357 [Yersinia
MLLGHLSPDKSKSPGKLFYTPSEYLFLTDCAGLFLVNKALKQDSRNK